MVQTTAILYQATPPPVINGIQKPMKPGGYSDSGADIACELIKHGFSIVTPVAFPNINNDLDWVFPDTIQGIQEALDRGANTLWLNTVLYDRHAAEQFFDSGIQFVGQWPRDVGIYDDKYYTNDLLRKNQIPIPENEIISAKGSSRYSGRIRFPMVIKPIRGRGSQGVVKIKNQIEFNIVVKKIFASEKFGDSVYAEQFLAGQEITVTVMPPGRYTIGNHQKIHVKPWSLPVIKRFNHQNGIAPYNGVVAVMENSSVLGVHEQQSREIIEVKMHCEKAGELLKIRAPIRIDCRANEKGKYLIFDVNLKPNMTGPSRPQRKNQDSLTLMAARQMGWNYIELLKNMLGQAW